MLSIIMVNYKSSKDIEISLESIKKYEPNYKKYEFIIVDNNSDDPLLEGIGKKFPFVKIVYAPLNGGFAYGNNVGIKEAKGDCIFLLNPDTFIKDNSIEKLYKRLMENDDCHFAGPKVLYPDERNQSYYTPKANLTLWRLFCERFFLHRIFKKSKIFNSYFRTYMNYETETYVEQVAGSAFMFKRSIIDKIGLMDEGFFMYFEESDYCYQGVKAGFKLLYYPESIIYHVGGLVSQSNWGRSTRDFMDGFKIYFHKNFSIFTYYFALWLFFWGTLIRMIPLMLLCKKNFKYHFYYIKNIFKWKRFKNNK